VPDDTINREGLTEEPVHSRQEQKSHPLFAGHVKVYPRKVSGVLRRAKWAALIVLLAIYYVTPWIRWDRGPDSPNQAVLVDFVEQRFYFFFIEVWPQEIFYLTALLVLAALVLFLATTLFGRVWCGYTCPQTVWTDLFMWVERQIEGDRNARMRLDKQPLSVNKVWRKAAKHSIWLVIALATGGAWIMYFQDAPTLVTNFFTGQAGTGTYFFVGLFTGTTYLLAGWAREQVCTYMCPWPRFQAALLDEDSLVVTYRKWRGEPRGKHKKGESWEGRGDCIDCKACVAVCPTGIDIRDGIQLECIGCGLCIDACNDVMDKVGRPRGLIAFDTERNQERAEEGKKPVFPLIRFRTIAYVVLIVAVAGLTTLGLAGRSTVDLNVIHDRNPLFVTLSDGSIRNGYEIRILNKVREERTFTLSVEGLEQASFRVVGQEEAELPQATLTAPPDATATYQVYVSAPPTALAGEQTDITFILDHTGSEAQARRGDVFRGP
jgi:cytochrome c oxidase accessory protein FixG